RSHVELQCRNVLELFRLRCRAPATHAASRFAYPWRPHEQCSCGKLWPKCLKGLERAKAIEPSTISLASSLKSLNPLGFSANRAHSLTLRFNDLAFGMQTAQMTIAGLTRGRCAAAQAHEMRSRRALRKRLVLRGWHDTRSGPDRTRAQRLRIAE